MILGATIFARTDSPTSSDLKSRVAASWGTQQTQSPPTASYTYDTLVDQKTDHGTEKTTVTHTECLPIDSSKIDVGLKLAHRQKGLLWYSTYAASFAGDYTFTNNSGLDREITFQLPFPANQ